MRMWYYSCQGSFGTTTPPSACSHVIPPPPLLLLNFRGLMKTLTSCLVVRLHSIWLSLKRGVCRFFRCKLRTEGKKYGLKHLQADRKRLDFLDFLSLRNLIMSISDYSLVGIATKRESALSFQLDIFDLKTSKGTVFKKALQLENCKLFSSSFAACMD